VAISLDALTGRHGAVPPAAPLAMPPQSLAVTPEACFKRPTVRTWLARLVTFAGALTLTAYAGSQMVLIVSLAESTSLQWLMVALFVITFGWIALAACGAVAGVLFGAGYHKARSDAAPTTRTVLLMPIYNEDPCRTFAALHAMGASLIEQAVGERFEIFVISDTNEPEIWIRETAAIQTLRESLGERVKVWYRRRHDNRGKKAGNIRDFVTHWGSRYDQMIVLDADSILSANTLTALVCEMEADPDCGIVQTLPRLAGGKTLFARMQQFAGAVYGPIVARGITSWQGDDGNYWGHNAVIRVAAFAAAAGLPTLAGRKPFGGEILSHDFVEAALVRRAGWSVRMLPALGGSWEASPPSLIDFAVRDRRWAQGNLQHLRVVSAKGLRWPNRMHMLIGVMSYLVSPIWLALIAVGLAIAVQAASAKFDYFTEEFQLFPNWPVFDSERMVALFVLTMGVLLVPKALGLLRALANDTLRRSVGVIPLCFSVVVEIALSVLYAPIFMLLQSQQVWEILRGRDSGWSAQQRDYHALPWRALLERHAWHTVVGSIAMLGLVYVSLPLLAWMAPTVLGLTFAVPLSALSGSVSVAKGLRFLGLLTIPEETTTPPVMAARDEFERRLRAEIEPVTLERLVREESSRRQHFAMGLSPPAPPRGCPDVRRLSAALKIADAAHTDEALAWLTTQERIALLTHAELFESLLELRVGPLGADDGELSVSWSDATQSAPVACAPAHVAGR
jgi:membrane glycosyltransferase